AANRFADGKLRIALYLNCGLHFSDDPADAIPAEAGERKDQHQPREPALAGRTRPEPKAGQAKQRGYEPHVECGSPSAPLGWQERDPATIGRKHPATDVGPKVLDQAPRAD